LTSAASRAAVLVRTVRIFAAFDLVVTGCLAVPPFARALIGLLFAGDAAFDLGSLRVEFHPLHWLFVNLAGVLGVLWAVARLRTPTRELALLDVVGRLAVAAVILHATSAEGMTPRLHAFVASELIGAAAQYWAVRRALPAPSGRGPSVKSRGDLRIRAYQESDLEPLLALVRAVFPDPAPHNEPQASILRKWNVDRELLLVGHSGATLVATAMGGWDGHRGWIYQVAVAQDARGQGHGRAIVEAIEARLRARGCPKLNLQVLGSNPAAVEFWRKLGYRVEERVSLGKLLEPSQLAR
jgi:ribosomal protein S18 acetylase RimI-like enzyme